MLKNHIFTIFGGTGDLTYRKLLPAIYNLENTKKVPESFHIVVIGRQDLDTEEYLKNLIPWIHDHCRFKIEAHVLQAFLDRIVYFKMVFTEDEGYLRLSQFFNTLDMESNTVHQRLFYFAVAPDFFVTIASKLQAYNLVSEGSIIIEKPFGNDLSSANQINGALTQIFDEEHIFRIDHYIAKEMVQNTHTIRFANAIFNNIWNHNMIEHIQISVAETVGVENRGNFYDITGALKDMFQSHILQILSIATMEEPEVMSAEKIHLEQEKILENLMIRDYERDVIYGQYTANKDSLGYLEEDRVSKDSKTDTFVALKLYINNETWRDVPIFIRTGKRMHKRSSEIVFQLKAQNGYNPNIIVIKIQPDEGVYIRFNIKKPGHSNDTETVFMDFCQSCNFEFRSNTPEAYERLLDAALQHDHTLFASFKQVELSWKFTEDIVARTQGNPIHNYPAFSSGPQASLDLLETMNFEWFEEKLLGDN